MWDCRIQRRSGLSLARSLTEPTLRNYLNDFGARDQCACSEKLQIPHHKPAINRAAYTVDSKSASSPTVLSGIWRELEFFCRFRS